ncbi:MAG: hypothetical protein IJW24_00440 [Clostridia bacterium]|nr:hypothetical protein [Clostridia bacterium]
MSDSNTSVKNIEQGAKRVTAGKIVNIVTIIALFLVLIFCYYGMFSSGLAMGSARAVGVIDAGNFYGASFGDMITIEKVSDIKTIEIGDVVVYHLNGEVGSVKVSLVDYDKKIIYSKEDNVQRTLAFELILGKQKAQVPVLGAIIGFFVSPAGVTVLSAVLLAYLYFLTFSRINKEETEKGKQLAKQLKAEKEENKIRRRLLENFRRTEGFSAEDSNIIDGSMGDNLIELVSYTSNGAQKSVTDTYSYILEKVHRTYMTKQRLSKRERTRVSNVIEMFPIVEKVDDGMAFRLVDLILHEQVLEFDVVGFEKLCLKFFSKNITKQDLSNFGSVLYVLIQKNKKMKISSILRIVGAYCDKVKSMNIEKDSEAFEIAEKLKDVYLDKRRQK